MSKASSLDQFYTSKKIVEKFLKIIKNKGLINSDSVLIEPSAGDGKFLDGFEKFFPKNNYFAFDIEKNDERVKQKNFLKTNKKFDLNNIVIGNPPFGNRSKLAIEFINHSSKFSNVICFVLPIQFKRWGVHKQINKNLKLIYSSNSLPQNSFILNNKPYNVNCILQIWVSNNDERFDKFKDKRIKKATPNSHKDFKLWIHNNTRETLKYFNKEKYNWDFAVHRQGFYDYNDKISDSKKLIKNRQYLFIKIINPKAKNILMKKINFEKLANSNTSIKGFSNTDLVKEYEKIKRERDDN